ncbi:MAG: CvpA family protein [Elusimicrobiota bacterium]
MNWVDIAIFLIIVVFAWIGSRIGILTAISSILSGLVGSVVANLFYIKFAVFLPPKPSSLIISYFMIFIVVSVVIFYLGHAFSKLVNILFFGLIDRLLGALLGIVLGAIICGAILVIAVLIPRGAIKYYVKNSTLAPFVVEKIIAPVIKPFSNKNYEAITKDITSDVIKRFKSLPPPLR